MITTSTFCRNEYGRKLYKISFDAGFSCPGRDGSLGSRGCIFCSEGGSGDFAVKLPFGRYRDAGLKAELGNSSDAGLKAELGNSSDAGLKVGPENRFGAALDVETQISEAKRRVSSKFDGEQYIAYFQAFTNTYASAEELRKIYWPVINRDDIAVLSIATRPDSISPETYDLLEELNRIKPVWVELGLQTTKEESIQYIRRGYKNDTYVSSVKKLNEIGIHTITHVILYLPGEDEEDMLSTVRFAVRSGTKGIKLQLLQVLKGTDMYEDYLSFPERFTLPSLEEYAKMVAKCVYLCPEDMVFHRLTGDPPRALLAAPSWATDKKRVLNEIHKALEKIKTEEVSK